MPKGRPKSVVKVLINQAQANKSQALQDLVAYYFKKFNALISSYLLVPTMKEEIINRIKLIIAREIMESQFNNNENVDKRLSIAIKRQINNEMGKYLSEDPDRFSTFINEFSKLPVSTVRAYSPFIQSLLFYHLIVEKKNRKGKVAEVYEYHSPHFNTFIANRLFYLNPNLYDNYVSYHGAFIKKLKNHKFLFKKNDHNRHLPEELLQVIKYFPEATQQFIIKIQGLGDSEIVNLFEDSSSLKIDYSKAKYLLRSIKLQLITMLKYLQECGQVETEYPYYLNLRHYVKGDNLSKFLNNLQFFDPIEQKIIALHCGLLDNIFHSNKEIASITGLSISAIDYKYQQIRVALRKMLKTNTEEEAKQILDNRNLYSDYFFPYVSDDNKHIIMKQIPIHISLPMKLFYGLEGLKKYKIEEIAYLMGISTTLVSSRIKYGNNLFNEKLALLDVVQETNTNISSTTCECQMTNDFFPNVPKSDKERLLTYFPTKLRNYLMSSHGLKDGFKHSIKEIALENHTIESKVRHDLSKAQRDFKIISDGNDNRLLELYFLKNNFRFLPYLLENNLDQVTKIISSFSQKDKRIFELFFGLGCAPVSINEITRIVKNVSFEDVKRVIFVCLDIIYYRIYGDKTNEMIANQETKLSLPTNVDPILYDATLVNLKSLSKHEYFIQNKKKVVTLINRMVDDDKKAYFLYLWLNYDYQEYEVNGILNVTGFSKQDACNILLTFINKINPSLLPLTNITSTMQQEKIYPFTNPPYGSNYKGNIISNRQVAVGDFEELPTKLYQ